MGFFLFLQGLDLSCERCVGGCGGFVSVFRVSCLFFHVGGQVFDDRLLCLGKLRLIRVLRCKNILQYIRVDFDSRQAPVNRCTPEYP